MKTEKNEQPSPAISSLPRHGLVLSPSMAIITLSSSSSSSKPPLLSKPDAVEPNTFTVRSSIQGGQFRRDACLRAVAVFSVLALGPSLRLAFNAATFAEAPAKKPSFSGILSTKSWFQFFGDGFSIRVPPEFEDIMEPEEYTTGFSFYGDKAKPRVFAARFASPDRSETVSVVIRPSNQLKITFLEARVVQDLGSLKEAAKIFVPGGATLYSARTIKIKEDEDLRTYYFYEFGIDNQHAVLVATVDSGKAYIAGAAAPEPRWEEDGAKLRSAAISMAVL